MQNIAAVSPRVNKTPDLIGANRRLLQLRQQFAGRNAAVREVLPAQQVTVTKVASPVVEQKSGWLAPISPLFVESTVSKSTEIASRTTTQQLTISVPTDILTGLLRSEMAGIGRIWLLGRHLDKNGSGWVSIETLRQSLTVKSSPLRVCGWRRLRQLLQVGKGILWERDDLGRLWLFGLAHVATNLDLARFAGKAVSLPIDAIIGSIATVKATFLAAFHAGRKVMPISRAALRQATGIPERTQQEYDKRANTDVDVNLSLSGSFSVETQKEHAFKHGGASFTFVDKQGKHGAAGARYHARQLPNNYQNQLETVNFGRKRKLNHQLRHQTDLVNIVARGNGQEQLAVKEMQRRYFDDGKRAAKSAGRGQVTLLQTSKGVWHEWVGGSEKSCGRY
jgi:hypothetical protein